MKYFVFSCALIILPLLSLGLPYNSLDDLYSPDYDYDDNNEILKEGGAMKAPGFVSKELDIVVTEGDTIELPCIVTRLQGFVLLWKKNGNIITVGDQVITHDNSRYFLEAKENGNTLVITAAKLEDEGDYICQVSAFKPTQIHHSVKIRVKPSIQTSPVKSLTVAEGEEARLYCRVVAGHPKPNLKWRKQGELMPSGQKEISGEDIIFESVPRSYAGTYECMTEGEDQVTSEVELLVKYPPEIELEETHIKTRAGQEIHVTCTVDGYPDPFVVWEKDGHTIEDDTAEYVISTAGYKHSLVILDVKPQVFGEYTCQAQNPMGVARNSAVISAYAEEAQIKPTPVNLSSKSLEVEWTAHSETPITIFRVQFMANNASDWSEVDVTATKLANEEWYGKADLLNLHPSTQYMVRVSSLNTEGYSKFSDAQMFTTSNKGQVKQDKITASSSPTISVSSLLCLVSLSSALISSEVLLK